MYVGPAATLEQQGGISLHTFSVLVNSQEEVGQ